MKKGLEITFQLNQTEENQKIVLALANITGNKYKENLVNNWQIFHVTLGKDVYYKVLFSGKGIGVFHQNNEKEIRAYFDNLSKQSYEDLIHKYETEEKNSNFQKVEIKELKEEYDLWQDRFWDYL
jgi:predicted sulfurtransferase